MLFTHSLLGNGWADSLPGAGLGRDLAGVSMDKQLTVGQLREVIKGLPNDSVVLIATTEWSDEADPDGMMVDSSVPAISAISNYAKSTLTISSEEN